MYVVNKDGDCGFFYRNAIAGILRMAYRRSKGGTKEDQLGDLQYSKQEVINVGLHQHGWYGVVRSHRVHFKGRT